VARPLRVEYPHASYHITSRGNARQDIFLNDYDYKDFLKTLKIVATRFHWLVYAYCLMDNHYHLVVETIDANLSSGMRQLNGEYAQLFNWWHKKTGHVFQGRYKAILVEKESYLFEVCRYVVLNPIRARIVMAPGEWKWSSYNATLGQVDSVVNLAVEKLLALFGDDQRLAVRGYIDFINDGIGKSSIWEELKGQIILGSDDFVDKINDMLERKKENMEEIPQVQRYIGRPLLENIFCYMNHKNKRVKAQMVKKAYSYGYTMRQIAGYLGVHYTTVSRLLKKSEKMLYCKT
jgi:putative transposase